jgi:hypothetical protein
MSNIIQFNPKSRSIPATAEEIMQKQIQEEEDFIDSYVERFIVDAASRFVDLDEHDLPIKFGDEPSKMLAFLRESLIATLHLLQSKEHPLHEVAEELVEFTDSEEIKEINIELDS